MLPVEKSVHPSCPRGARAPWHRPALSAFALAALAGACHAQTAGDDTWSRGVRQLASQVTLPEGARLELEVGTLDPRLKLAPCARITPYLPAGTRLWGHARVGLRCDEGARWNVFVPVTVRVFATTWSVNQALPLGTVLQASHLQQAEADLAAEPSPVLRDPQAAIGRTLARAIRPGQPLREADLKQRQWFAAGDIVRVVTVGAGFSITADGQALNAGFDGQSAKVRIDGGRVVSGRATAERRIEVTL
jgi:flagella basal body P-ring formation protein FlgA